MQRNHVLLLTFSFLLLSQIAISAFSGTNSYLAAASGTSVTVHFIDVGQGDSILIDASGVEVLVDGGPKAAGNTVVNYLNQLGVTHVGWMVATHMDEDHIGGLISVLNSDIQVDTVLINNESTTTQSYSQFIGLIQNHTFLAAQRGQVYTLTSTVNLTFFNPIQPPSFNIQNEDSIVLKLQAGQTSFLLEGDAGSSAEQSMINAGLNLTSDVLKVGHHGSAYATTDTFLNKVQPTYAVISCGLNNTYGHPSPSTIQRLASHNVGIYRTDELGSIVATTDGTTVSILNNSSTPTPTSTEAPTITQTTTLTPTPTNIPSPTQSPSPSPSVPELPILLVLLPLLIVTVLVPVFINHRKQKNQNTPS
jgi:competence protein ComEC